MTHQPYEWPRPTAPEAKDAAREHRKASRAAKRAQRSTDPNIHPALAVLLVAATVVGGIVLNVHLYKHADAQYDWAANAGVVQQALNDKYVEDIQVIRQEVSTGRGHTWVQTFGIDGDVRTDCEVPDDTNPVIVCDVPVTLTPETASPADTDRGDSR